MKDLLNEAIGVFNRGDYFAAAEHFERAAADARPELRDLVGALNRIAAAFHLRFYRGGRQSAINLLSQAMLILEDYKPARAGIDVERLARELSAFTDDLRATPRDEHDNIAHRARLFLERRRAPKIHLGE
jgi:predicted metal-dependent hydrolase